VVDWQECFVVAEKKARRNE